MSDSFPFSDYSQLREWHSGIQTANRNNIFCHCRSCGYEWVDSSTKAVCTQCGSKDVEHISCWQFPDD
ncbi:hypothetical protein ACF3DV_00960 [Chlorogloeopsis fritschii PCC 9212]|uniref:hypothetical protein n=1 Tax=Chlorogloeopsis fritschii TaxID=1124 RepID=UPI00031CB0F6|nr:hypothetical protein [Chlorogloeopsis fritschii]